MSAPLRVGVVCAADADRPALEAFVAQFTELQPKWYAPGELHDLDRDVRRGRIERVVFAGLPDLLRGIWEEELEFEQWPAGVRVEFVRPPGDDTVQAVAASWRQWRARHRRRQAVAGAVLSAIVLAAAFVLCVVLAK